MPKFIRSTLLRVQYTYQEIETLIQQYAEADIANGFTLEDGTVVDTGGFAFVAHGNMPDGGVFLSFAEGVTVTDDPNAVMVTGGNGDLVIPAPSSGGSNQTG